MPKTHHFVSMLALALALPLLACAQQPDGDKKEQAPNELALTTEKIIVFKDGYCLVLKRGKATSNESGQVFTTDVPDAAVLGSFWATPSNGRMLSMVAGWEESTVESSEQVACSQTLEVLRANEGRDCTLRIKERLLEGKILSVLTKETQTPVTAAHHANLDSSLVRHLRSFQPPPAASQPQPVSHVTNFVGSQFVLRTEAGDMLLNASEVRELTVRDMKTSIDRKVTNKLRHKRLTFRFEEKNKEHEILIAYFRPGVRWIPTYRIDLDPSFDLTVKKDGKETTQKMAKISMQAELINEAEDVLDAPIDIVVGVPNFRFRTITSPFTLEKVLQNALQQSAPQLMGQFRNDLSNALYTQRRAEVRRPAAAASGPAAAGLTELPNELTASGAQELFVYNLPAMALKKGERAAVPIFNITAPYRNVYTWDLHIRRDDIATAPSGSGVASPLTLSNNKVWRQIELTNNTKLPWTTGAAMIMQGQQPLAQELLTYTSVKDMCRVPVTVAVDVRGSHAEQEIGRQLKHLRWNHSDYAKIRQRSSLNICNHKAETIDLEISMKFGGKAEKVTDDGAISLTAYDPKDWQRYRGDPAVNNSSMVRWKKTLKPGEVFEPTVEYFFYTRH